MTKYAKIINNQIEKVSSRPVWLNENGEPVTDSVLIQGGYLPVIDNKPDFDEKREIITQNSQDQWIINNNNVEITYTISSKSIDQQKNEKIGEARKKFNETLKSGFTDSNGVTWQAIDEARNKILDLTQRIQEFRAGNVSSVLPQNKTTIKLRDATGAPQDVDATKILQLAEQGSDFKDAAEDRLEELIGQIQNAQSQADLDNINITTGWPPFN